MGVPCVQTCTHFRDLLLEDPTVWGSMLAGTYDVQANELEVCAAAARQLNVVQHAPAAVRRARRSWPAARQLTAWLAEARANMSGCFKLLRKKGVPIPTTLPTSSLRDRVTSCLEDMADLTARPFPQPLQFQLFPEDMGTLVMVLELTKNSSAKLAGPALAIVANCLEMRSGYECGVQGGAFYGLSCGRRTTLTCVMQDTQTVLRNLGSQFEAAARAGSRALLNAMMIDMPRGGDGATTSTTAPRVQLRCVQTGRHDTLAPGLWKLAKWAPWWGDLGCAPPAHRGMPGVNMVCGSAILPRAPITSRLV